MFDKIQDLNEVIPKINSIDSSKLAKFLNRFIEKIDENFENIFSSDEKHKLKSIISVNSLEEIDLIVKTIHSLLRQIVYNLTKPKVLTKELTDLGLDTEKVVIFVDLWNQSAPELVDKLKNKSFDLCDTRLSSVDWKLKLLGDQSDSSGDTPALLAQLDFTFSHDSQKNSHISIDFDSKQLWNLYESVEQIQTQLDSLYK